ncbi:tetratricopeptide repeat protein [Candidatus Sumerlaeota bacterium]|nr:tetratricopeptide repeat protein [Candidatus Sumerlaeota bacterium]
MMTLRWTLTLLALVGVVAMATTWAQTPPAPVAEALRAQQAGDSVRAVTLWEQALADDPESTALRTNLARALIETGDLPRARQELATVLEAEPERASAWNLLGRIERLEDNLEAALEAFRHAVDSAPDQAWYLNNLGYTLLDLDRPQEALAPLGRAVELDAGQVVMWNNLGVARMRVGDFDGAREAFETALSINPDHSRARQNLESLQGDRD